MKSAVPITQMREMLTVQPPTVDDCIRLNVVGCSYRSVELISFVLQRVLKSYILKCNEWNYIREIATLNVGI